MTDVDPFVEARAQVAQALAGDVPYIQPPDQRNVVGEAVLLSLGSAVVGAFAAGVIKAAAGQAEEWAKNATGWLMKRIRAAFAGEGEAAQNEVADQEYVRLTVTLDRESLETLTVTATTTLTVALEEAGLPAKKARQVADVTRQQMLPK